MRALRQDRPPGESLSKFPRASARRSDVRAFCTRTPGGAQLHCRVSPASSQAQLRRGSVSISSYGNPGM